MSSKQTIRVVIEVEVTEHDQFQSTGQATQSAVPAAYAFQEQDLLHEQALWIALRTDAVSYAEYIRTIIIGSLETYGINGLIPSLAQLVSPYGASLTVLQNLFPTLPLATQHYFQQALQEGWLSEGTQRITDAIEACPIRLTVEYPGTEPIPSL